MNDDYEKRKLIEVYGKIVDDSLEELQADEDLLLRKVMQLQLLAIQDGVSESEFALLVEEGIKKMKASKGMP